MKTCTKCKQDKALNDFYKDSRKSDGLFTHCKTCHRVYTKRWEQDNSEARNELSKKWWKAHPEKLAAKKKRWERRWRAKNPGASKARVALRRAIREQATPNWLNKDHLKQIREIYKNCPKGFHVDHIVPLKGKEVRGLHVPWNLQYLPSAVNIRKSNKWL